VGTLVRWFEYLAEAVSVTVQLQLIVAACNTLFTLPVLFLLGIPDKPALMVLIFVSGLVPVIGNIVSGAVLSVLAWIAAGPLGVGVFLVLTFVLHKVEAYYLNPRLTARHVKLPGFVLIISLICWEHLLGFAGLFVSFPFLFISGKIRGEMKAEDETESAGAQMPAVIAVVEPNQAPVSS
jgi:predicted PurR-regulated permease PerM